MESFDSLSLDSEAKSIEEALARADSRSQQDLTSVASNAQQHDQHEPDVLQTLPNSKPGTKSGANLDARQDAISVADEAPLFPQLTHEPLESPRSGQEQDSDEDEDFEVPSSFNRPSSPSSGLMRRSHAPIISDLEDSGVTKMHKFTLHETQNFYYIFGSDMCDTSYRVLKIDRTVDSGELGIIEDDIIYSKREALQILNAVDEGNRATGGMKLVTQFWGLLGFIKFTGPYYMILVTKRRQVAWIGGHYIHEVEKTEMFPLITLAASKVKSDKALEESRYVSIFNSLDLSRNFYFSNAYDITRTLQHNILRHRKAIEEGLPEPPSADHNGMFLWNTHLLNPAREVLKNPFDWCLALIHGYVDQLKFQVYSRVVTVAIIARRSRHFAGARYLKRGANDLGQVANDVETEQIVQEALTTSFHEPTPARLGLFANSNCSSYVQHRGSIPLHWSQDSSGVQPKPDINLSVSDPFYTAAALHFDDLFHRYGTPIYVLNLIKSRERLPREIKLLKEYESALKYLNQFLPQDKRIQYLSFDMSRATKAKDRNVIDELEQIASDIFPITGFFRNAPTEAEGLQLQRGVIRTNCIDCLDRTNAAQFILGKRALGFQLQALGLTESTFLDYDTDCVSMFTHMWQDHGDCIAIQYGGSHLVNTMSTYRKINQWTSNSRDLVESFKRFYNNSFLDAQRQEAYNLFLGAFTYSNQGPMLWEMSNDYYLHHTNPHSMFGRRRPSYRHWYTDKYLEGVEMPNCTWPQAFNGRSLAFFDDYWAEYYRPLVLQSFRKVLAFRMHSNFKYLNKEEAQLGHIDLSPFAVRAVRMEEGKEKDKNQGKGPKRVKMITPNEETSSIYSKDSSIDARLVGPGLLDKPPKPQALGNWIESQHQQQQRDKKWTGIIKDSSWEKASHTPTVPVMPSANGPGALNQAPTKQELATQAFTQLITKSLNPVVAETDEYYRYIEHPSNIALVVSSEIDPAKTPKQFLDYLSRTQDDTALVGDKLYFIDDEQGATSLTLDERAEISLEDYQDHIDIAQQDEVLTVTKEDWDKKRHKAYRQWLRGKSLFKQRFVVGGEVV